MAVVPDSDAPVVVTAAVRESVLDEGPAGGATQAVRAYCAECRYGVSIAHPGVCPMCRGTDWVAAETDPGPGWLDA